MWRVLLVAESLLMNVVLASQLDRHRGFFIIEDPLQDVLRRVPVPKQGSFRVSDPPSSLDSTLPNGEPRGAEFLCFMLRDWLGRLLCGILIRGWGRGSHTWILDLPTSD